MLKKSNRHVLTDASEEKMEAVVEAPDHLNEEDGKRWIAAHKFLERDAQSFIDVALELVAKDEKASEALMAEVRKRAIRAAAVRISRVDVKSAMDEELALRIFKLPHEVLLHIATASGELQRRHLEPDAAMVNEILDLATVAKIMEDDGPQEDLEGAALFR